MRLRLKRWEIDDAPALMEVINNVHVWRTLTNTTELPLSKDDAYDYINRCKNDRDNIDSFAIEFENNVVGGISLKKLKPPYHIIYELDFWLSPNHWRKGIMTEALYDIIQHGFMHLPAMKLIAKVFASDKKRISFKNWGFNITKKNKIPILA